MKLPNGKKPENIQHWIELLSAMEDKVYMISGQRERILHHYADGDVIVVKTNMRTRKIDAPKFREFMENVLEIDDTPVPTKIETATTPKVFKTLTDTLMENIEKIKNNPEYIPQAQAINNTAKQVIDIARTQVEVIRLQQSVK
jgi:hypothetical protein